jgi:peptidoglycan/LPS O-acetylase OafA/YrhL
MGISNFRYDFGFLRGIAVISVLIFHFNVPFFDGGFLGVDIFFLISGYLMTKIVLNGFSRYNFSLKEFYFKRIRRIFPVLIIVGFAILLISISHFLIEDAAQNAKNVVLSIMFISNIYYWLYTGYFYFASQADIFLHSWSLSVEWQFYLIYPFLLLVVNRLYLNNRKVFNSEFLGFTLISLMLYLSFTQFDNSLAFYMFPTRAWEMTIGRIAFLELNNFLNMAFYFVILTFTIISCIYLAKIFKKPSPKFYNCTTGSR